MIFAHENTVASNLYQDAFLPCAPIKRHLLHGNQWHLAHWVSLSGLVPQYWSSKYLISNLLKVPRLIPNAFAERS